MKVILLACALSAVTAWSVVTLTGQDAIGPTYDPAALDLEDRIASLEGRLARVAADVDAPTLQGASRPNETPAALLQRIADLEKALAALRKTPPPAEPEDASARREPATVSPPRQAPQERIAEARARADRLQGSRRVKALLAVAKEAGAAGLFESQEEVLREVIEATGRDSEVGQEALYNIGWARRNKGDAGAAREAWLTASDQLPRDHFRHGYARYYAAEMGMKAGESANAERELHDLIRDIEADPKTVDRHGTLIKRSRELLALLDR